MLFTLHVGEFPPSLPTKAGEIAFNSTPTQIFVFLIILKLVFVGFYLAASRLVRSVLALPKFLPPLSPSLLTYVSKLFL